MSWIVSKFTAVRVTMKSLHHLLQQKHRPHEAARQAAELGCDKEACPRKSCKPIIWGYIYFVPRVCYTRPQHDVTAVALTAASRSSSSICRRL